MKGKPIIDDVVLIKINRSYKEDMSSQELYDATSFSWVASFQKSSTRNLKYYCAVYQNRIVEVYDFLGYEEEIPKRLPPRYILQGKVSSDELRKKLVGLGVSNLHKGSGNPIKYTNVQELFKLTKNGVDNSSVLGELSDLVNKTIESKDLISHIYSYITSKGYSYSIVNIKNLYLSLRSKPFVIISGISGTGKTKIVQLFAESIGASEENHQFKLIPVRPDWSDSSELLGYVDLKGDFIKGPLTEMIEYAMAKPELPHFVLLDEMNLARVEYYLSDVLSVMESRKKNVGEVTSSLLINIPSPQGDKKIYLPNNLYIIGTVNMDETTHPFSKKVLDRANAIEFNEIDLNNFSFLENSEKIETKLISNKQLEASYIQIGDVYSQNKELVEKISAQLSSINKYLYLINAEIAYRVRDEICFYMVWNHQSGELLLDENIAFDFCIMQKILPRITGSGISVENTLKGLFEHLTGKNFEAELNVSLVTSSYPKSVYKIEEMLRRLQEDGFTSFWIS